ncbi:MAG: DUF192 domain-containing protein [Nitrospirae bacterium]|nr:DUF192 domain-containing protein [Nitrospirota bacterium]
MARAAAIPPLRALACLGWLLWAAPAGAAEWMWLSLPGGRPVLAEVMRAPADRARGMMFRPGFPDDRLMLFLYEADGVRKIWMKNCRFSLDVAWLDPAGRVVATLESVPPCVGEPCPVYGPDTPARHFVEGTAGWLERFGVVEGDALRLGPLLPAMP